jgi:uncharacterized Zn finger protein (UPF0148 family)
MKVCDKCHYEFDGKDGDNTCQDCERRTKRNTRAKARRAEMKDLYASLGMTQVRGALGGVYYE